MFRLQGNLQSPLVAMICGNVKLPLQVLYNTLPAEEVKIIFYTYLNLSVVKVICSVFVAMISGNSFCNALPSEELNEHRNDSSLGRAE